MVRVSETLQDPSFSQTPDNIIELGGAHYSLPDEIYVTSPNGRRAQGIYRLDPENGNCVEHTAQVDSSATLTKRVIIGARSIVSAQCTLFPDARVGHHVTLYDNVTIGDGSIVGNDVEIGRKTLISKHVEVNNRCTIGSGASIGEASVIGFSVRVDARRYLPSNTVIPPRSH